MVRDALAAAHGLDASAFENVIIRTTGDKVQDRALAEIGGKALWTKELDRALLDGEIDCAVHSMKDVETFRPDAIAIAAILPRASVEDRILGAESIESLAPNALVGTSSPRRAAQIRRIRPDLRVTLFRGNIDKRLEKLASGEVDATLLASAGLNRLGRADLGRNIPTETMLPAPAQGAVGVEIRSDDASTRAFLAPINDGDTARCVLAERAFLAALKADCHSPVAALATLNEGRLVLRAELFNEDGSAHVTGSIAEPATPADLAREMLDRAPPSVRALFEG